VLRTYEARGTATATAKRSTQYNVSPPRAGQAVAFSVQHQQSLLEDDV
jgi:hypothetical protein